MNSEPKNHKNPELFEPDDANLERASRADAPEAYHDEQEDEEAQAQSVAQDAMDGAADGRSGVSGDALGDSRKVRSEDEADDVQDVVDHMVQMENSGQIDMDAYRGERSDDDEEGALGPSGVERTGPRGAE